MNERVDIERVNAENKVESTKLALEERVKVHERNRKLAQARIDACHELLRIAPAQKDVLIGVINIWLRIRRHHEDVRDSAKALLIQLS